MDAHASTGSDYLEPYQRAIDIHGAVFEATLWKSRATQTIRFDVLMAMIELNGLRLLDAGCATGDLCEYLQRKGVQPSQYIGIDGLPKLIEQARSRSLANAEFVVGDFVAEPSVLKTGNPDIIFFSGSLNTVNEARAREIVAAAFDIAPVGVVFNFLSDRCSPEMRKADTGPARRFDTLNWLDWSMRTTTNLAFRQDYLDGHDATIGMFHVK